MTGLLKRIIKVNLMLIEDEVERLQKILIEREEIFKKYKNGVYPLTKLCTTEYEQGIFKGAVQARVFNILFIIEESKEFKVIYDTIKKIDELSWISYKNMKEEINIFKEQLKICKKELKNI